MDTLTTVELEIVLTENVQEKHYPSETIKHPQNVVWENHNAQK